MNEQKCEPVEVPEHQLCQWCSEAEGFPVIYMGDAALYCGFCWDTDNDLDNDTEEQS